MPLAMHFSIHKGALELKLIRLKGKCYLALAMGNHLFAMDFPYLSINITCIFLFVPEIDNAFAFLIVFKFDALDVGILKKYE